MSVSYLNIEQTVEKWKKRHIYIDASIFSSKNLKDTNFHKQFLIEESKNTPFIEKRGIKTL